MLSKSIDRHSVPYDNIIILGDFNSDHSDEYMDDLNSCNFRNLLNEPTWFKNLQNPSSIDLITSNRPIYFQHSAAIEYGLSDFHKLTLHCLKMIFKKHPPAIISYRDYKSYFPSVFRPEPDEILYFDLNFISHDTFVRIFVELLFNIHAPIKFK